MTARSITDAHRFSTVPAVRTLGLEGRTVILA